MNTLPAKYLLMTAIALVAMGCRKAHYEPDPADVPSGKALVTVVYDPGALGDRSYNDLIYAGVERTALAQGLRTMQFSPSTRSEGIAILQTYFEQMSMLRDTVRRLLIVAGWEHVLAQICCTSRRRSRFLAKDPPSACRITAPCTRPERLQPHFQTICSWLPQIPGRRPYGSR